MVVVRVVVERCVEIFDTMLESLGDKATGNLRSEKIWADSTYRLLKDMIDFRRQSGRNWTGVLDDEGHSIQRSPLNRKRLCCEYVKVRTIP